MLDAGEAIRKLALNLARYSGLAPLVRPFVGGVGAILMLHRVTASPARPHGMNRHLTIAPDFLDELITGMKADGYRFVTLDDALGHMGAGGGNFAVMTADDGYRDNLVEALPVLERHGVPIAVYVAPALIDGTAFLWWDVVEEIVERNAQVRVPTAAGEVVLDCSTPAKRLASNAWLHDHLGRRVAERETPAFLSALAERHGVDPLEPGRRSLMDWHEIGEMARHPLVTIGAHTLNHHNLRRLDEDEARRQIAGAADVIEEKIGQRPRHMAYPYGYASAVGCREVKLAQEAGFASAVTTRHGVLQAEHARHLLALPRISVNGRYQRVAHIRTMLSGVTTPLANAGKMVVTV
ncbi:polysaccharide deacetylase family protein [Kumtagia ephedrae]|uniref:Chitooligosaccharide deacetylase n=1 Tax=Kumtagia ephedrae TaxID=2116701 RepID=A0A2P7ST99_9HYPH|nr:polysaccharide deacetylase family protein [Mesorhizobium ephedrae]PSJ65713.1 polysaccharide deacetylase [Mesorhizobium ephedrae]